MGPHLLPALLLLFLVLLVVFLLHSARCPDYLQKLSSFLCLLGQLCLHWFGAYILFCDGNVIMLLTSTCILLLVLHTTHHFNMFIFISKLIFLYFASKGILTISRFIQLYLISVRGLCFWQQKGRKMNMYFTQFYSFFSTKVNQNSFLFHCERNQTQNIWKLANLPFRLHKPLAIAWVTSCKLPLRYQNFVKIISEKNEYTAQNSQKLEEAQIKQANKQANKP